MSNQEPKPESELCPLAPEEWNFFRRTRKIPELREKTSAIDAKDNYVAGQSAAGSPPERLEVQVACCRWAQARR
jgi:hypothetical protein